MNYEKGKGWVSEWTAWGICIGIRAEGNIGYTDSTPVLPPGAAMPMHCVTAKSCSVLCSENGCVPVSPEGKEGNYEL